MSSLLQLEMAALAPASINDRSSSDEALALDYVQVAENLVVLQPLKHPLNCLRPCMLHRIAITRAMVQHSCGCFRDSIISGCWIDKWLLFWKVQRPLGFHFSTTTWYRTESARHRIQCTKQNHNGRSLSVYIYSGCNRRFISYPLRSASACVLRENSSVSPFIGYTLTCCFHDA